MNDIIGCQIINNKTNIQNSLSRQHDKSHILITDDSRHFNCDTLSSKTHQNKHQIVDSGWRKDRLHHC